MFKVNNKETRTLYSKVFIVNFEQVNVDLVKVESSFQTSKGYLNDWSRPMWIHSLKVSKYEE